MNKLLCPNSITTQVVTLVFRWFKMKRKASQIFGPCTFKLFAPKVTWYHSGVSQFNLFCSLTNLLFSFNLKILFMNSRFSLFIVLYIYCFIHHIKFSTYIHSFSPSLLFLINLHKILSNYCIKIEELSLVVELRRSRNNLRKIMLKYGGPTLLTVWQTLM